MERKDIDSTLLRTLADGQFHSGEVLGQAVGISRASVNKRMKKLGELGVDVFRVTGKGYRLAKPIQLLDGDEIRGNLPYVSRNLPFELLHVIDSTNDELKRLLTNSPEPLEAGFSVLAEMQTKGRGRRGRPWFSPFGTNLYLSMYWPLKDGLNSATGLSVALGLALARELDQAGIQDVSVKWPNDVYIKGKKVAGILVELEGQAMGEGDAIIGMGINLAMPEESALIDQPFTSIEANLEAPMDRNLWAALIMHRCVHALRGHDVEGLANVLATWRRFDHFYNQPVRVLLGQHEHVGIGQGIDDMGAFLVQQEDGLKRYFGGEISVRKPRS
ncbi:bifunctional biotin--[acetyl-CoA-carboxylase] ligase/biotin operon repressor BirA [Aliidiomarina sanyensis]|uniref:Bifunctional ligase/repressor BirA n=1 Tax=Aliidiomarina sanyensis TaxID=1249555 RepID=A0A432WAL4_9GAMM|nr:bifunctional biotin--[acetyl-CoA-carboxylase] ligase/biotin operon repressor BirA [Aliidiomarina sanyensis]RUO27454.1 bifunctional biotin--[acetyl-CoA-carboxylase] synthetase/biotin operon repressor [Aliidiomarina sanyensis]